MSNPAVVSTLGGHHTHLFQEPGQDALSPSLVAKALDITERELASIIGVSLNVLRFRPESQDVQTRICNFAGVFDLLLELKPDPVDAAFHMKNTPIRLLNHRTLLEAVKDNESEKAKRYLLSILSGYVG